MIRDFGQKNILEMYVRLKQELSVRMLQNDQERFWTMTISSGGVI